MKKIFKRIVIGSCAMMAISLGAIAQKTGAETNNVNLSYSVNPSMTLSLSGSATATLDPKSKVEGTTSEGATPFYTRATIVTNSVSGYTLTVKDKDSVTSLKHSSSTSDAIPAITGTAITSGTPGWGYKKSGDTNWKGITTSAVAVASSDNYSSGAQVVDVVYGVATGENTVAGSYSDTIVYTATTK